MSRYILKRLLIFLPTLWVISVLIFVLSRYAPGDPVTAILGSTDEIGQNGIASTQARMQAERELSHTLGLDRPLFYATLATNATPDTLYKISNTAHQLVLNRLLNTYGNWTYIEQYYTNLVAFSDSLRLITAADNADDALITLRANMTNLLYVYEPSEIEQTLTQTTLFVQQNPSCSRLQPYCEALQSNFNDIKTKPTLWRNYLPKIIWFGFDNQYHLWISRFLRLDFGISYRDKRPVATAIGERIGWTILLSGISMLLMYSISIPLGVYSAKHRNSRREGIITTLLFVLHSLPNFWIATLLIVFFCQPDYFFWFPAYGLSDKSIAIDGFFITFADQIWHLVLPLFCLSFNSIAFLTRQMRTAIVHNLQQDYIRTARAKGVSEYNILWKHALRNSLLPIITQFASILPNLIAGSLFLEQIFTIPGMGNYFYNAILFKDYPVVFTIVMLTSLLTIVGYLLSDVLYAFADPRIRFK